MRPVRLVATITILLGTASLAVALPAGAAKGGGSGTTSNGSSISVVVVDATTLQPLASNVPHFGQTITYNVVAVPTTKPGYDSTKPWVITECKVNGVVVLNAAAGFFDGYLWPGSRYITLSNLYGGAYSWTSGPGDCTAQLIYTNTLDTKRITVATLTYHVYA